MILPPTPITPSSGLRSPISIDGSQSTLVNGDDENDLRKDKHAVSSNASLVLEKLQQILEPDEFAESVGKAPNIVVIGRESAGKSSVLNALTAVPLYVAAGTATRGPMKIASIKTPGKAFMATIQIEAISSVGVTKKHVFTRRPLTNLSQLRSAIKLAGDEARRIESEGECRSFEDLQNRIDEGGMSPSHIWPEYTMNTIIVNISGPDQVDLHMTDLPGLGRATSAHAVANMITHHVIKKENIIVHCMAACGGSPGNDDCIKLNTAADPTGERTMIVLTQVDRIDDPSEDPWTDVITGRSDAFDGWRPQLGVHAVRLAGPRELKAGLVASQVRAIEQQLFASTEWVDIAKMAKVDGFGVAVTRQKVLDLHEARITGWLQGVPRLLQEKRDAAVLARSLLPALPDDPISAMHHKVIHTFVESQARALAIQGPTFSKLVILQEHLIKDLNSAVPAVVPLFKKDSGKEAALNTVWGFPLSATTVDHTEKIWIDDLRKLRDEHRSARTGRFDDGAVLADLIKKTVASWEATIETYVKNVWATVSECVEVIATLRPSTSFIIIQAMSKLASERIADSRAFIKTVLDVSSSDPAMTGTIKDVHLFSLIRNSAKFLNHDFETKYKKPASPSSPATSSSSTVEKPLSIPKGISSDEIREILRLQSEISAHLLSAVFHVGTFVPQKVQTDLLAYVEQAEARLRVAFDLEKVELGVRKRAAGLFETKTDRVKRAKVLEREKSLSEIEAIVQEALDA